MPHIHVEHRPRSSPLAPILAFIIVLLIVAAIWYFFFGPGRAYLPAGFPKGFLDISSIYAGTAAALPEVGLIGVVNHGNQS